ncbi:HEAT repeat domain-containing protein [Candidatus Latescibacterota bacterium]
MFMKRAIVSILVVITLVTGCSKSTDDLIKMLRSDSSRERTKAGVKLMGRHGDRDTVLKLIDILDDNDERVAFIALQVLGSLADTVAIEPLGKMIDHPEKEFRARVCYSLGSIGHEKALPYLIHGLGDETPEVRHSAVSAMGYLPHEKISEYTPHLYRMLRDDADSVRAAAVHSLYNYRNAEKSNVMAADIAIALNDPSDLVRYVAVQALGGGFQDSTVAGDLLIESLNDQNKFVRLESIISLQKIRYREAVPKLKEMYDTATVDEEFAISESIMAITNETFPPY